MLDHCQELLEVAIDEIKDDPYFKSEFEKELEVVKRMKYVNLDMSGTCEDLARRLKNADIYLLNRDDYEQMVDKSIRYDAIRDYVRTYYECHR